MKTNEEPCKAEFEKWFKESAKSPIDPWHKAFAQEVWQAACNTRQDKWLPISEAPDDMEILITGGKYQSICSGSSKWIKTKEVYLGKKYKGDNYYTIDDYFKVKNPTHFQYLPIPPKGE